MEKESNCLQTYEVLKQVFDGLQEKLNDDIVKHGLNPTEFKVLELLNKHEKLPTQAVAKEVGITSGAITYVATSLSEKGLIEKKKCEKDSRFSYLSITEKGKNSMVCAFNKYKELLDDIFKPLNETEQETLKILLKKLGNFGE